MRRVIGIDVYRSFGEVAFWEDGRLRHAGRIDTTRTAPYLARPCWPVMRWCSKRPATAWRCRELWRH